MNKQIALAALAAVALAACSENGGMTTSPRSAASLAARLTADAAADGSGVGPDGALAAIPGSTRVLSGAGVGPAQVAFSPDGLWLIVTEKTTNLLDVYAVGPDGVVTGRTSYASAGGTPFGFAFGHRDELFVSEAVGSASSYVLGVSGGVAAVSGAVATHQGAPCWLVVTKDGRFAYTANAQGASIAGFAVGVDA